LIYELFCQDNLDIQGKTYYIESVRAFVEKDDKILMLYSKKNKDFKFPGGKKEIEESFEKALFREILEETGYEMTTCSEYFEIIEYDKGQFYDEDIFKMLSKYYKVEVDFDNLSSVNFTETEKKLELCPVWVEAEKAYEQNMKLLKNKKNKIKWLKRECMALEIYLEKF
jgi:ADP-ribose pyrophosphatase YjhB (NUDIX family)